MNEIESVVFYSVEETDRLGTSNLKELTQVKLQSVLDSREDLQHEILDATRGIDRELRLAAQKTMLERRKKDLAQRKKANLAELEKLVVKKENKDSQRFDEISQQLQRTTRQIQLLKLQKTKLANLSDETARTFSKWQTAIQALREKYAESEVTENEWRAFLPTFAGKPLDIVKGHIQRIDKDIQRLSGPSSVSDSFPVPPKVSQWPLSLLTREHQKLQQRLGLQQRQAKAYAQLSKATTEITKEQKEVDDTLKKISSSKTRTAEFKKRRRQAYASVFSTLAKEEQLLNDLYSPLHEYLEHGEGSLGRLEFYVHRRIDIDAWVETGTNLVDTRKAGVFQGRGALADIARSKLQPAWSTGGADEVAAAMDSFLDDYRKDLWGSLRKGVTSDSISNWLFSTEHISLSYGIRYDGVELDRLSPGMRGIVLLLVYLAVDRWDTRPLIIDQPEENLDPQSVYEELVGYFREVRKRRQVILVTHNANLVVNADADQVIIASSHRKNSRDLPELSYIAGSLENEKIRDEVCRILEGGQRAFRDRERRYALS